MIPRPRLVARLEAATRASRVVVVDAEAGAGKTAVISAWAAQAGAGTLVAWRTLGQEDVAATLDRLPFEEPDLIVGDDLPAVDRQLVVLDGFPADADPVAQTSLEGLLHRLSPRVGVVLISAGAPRLDIQRLGIQADSLAFDSAELAMNRTEVAAVLARHAVDPEPTLVEDVWRRTHGWTWGVRLAADWARRSDSVADQLRAVDRAVTDYLDCSVLRSLTTDEVELLTIASIIEQVSDGPAYDVGARLTGTVTRRSRGFVRTQADGSFTLHPLLRQQLLTRLRHDDGTADRAARRAAQVLADDLRVVRLLSGRADPLLDQPELLDRLGTHEPALLAAAALRRGWPDLAARALEPMVPTYADGTRTVTSELSVTLARIALARWQGDVATGLACHQRATDLVSQLGVAQRAAHPALIPLLHAQLGALNTAGGVDHSRVDESRVALERGARLFRTRPGHRVDPEVQCAAADCLGQLAWWQARSGELSDAARHAAVLLADPQHGYGRVATDYARLAAVWCHLSRGELLRAMELFDSPATIRPTDGSALPELAAASELTAARLAGYGAATVAHPAQGHRYQHELLMIRAEAELDACSPAAALAILAEATVNRGDAQVLRARAAILLGDVAGAAAAMRRRPIETVTLQCQVQLELIEGWLAGARRDRSRERVLADRVLRTAGREQLRVAIGWAKSWLQEVVTSDAELLSRHGHFLASVNGMPQVLSPAATRPGPVIPLTGRELDILQRLGTLGTNEEIAADLFLSTNTVKSHLKSLFRKLEVNRRSEAFRRGRALGLC